MVLALAAGHTHTHTAWAHQGKAHFARDHQAIYHNRCQTNTHTHPNIVCRVPLQFVLVWSFPLFSSFTVQSFRCSTLANLNEQEKTEEGKEGKNNRQKPRGRLILCVCVCVVVDVVVALSPPPGWVLFNLVCFGLENLHQVWASQSRQRSCEGKGKGNGLRGGLQFKSISYSWFNLFVSIVRFIEGPRRWGEPRSYSY